MGESPDYFGPIQLSAGDNFAVCHCGNAGRSSGGVSLVFRRRRWLLGGHDGHLSMTAGGKRLLLHKLGLGSARI